MHKQQPLNYPQGAALLYCLHKSGKTTVDTVLFLHDPTATADASPLVGMVSKVIGRLPRMRKRSRV